MHCSNRGSARPKTVLPNVTFRIARDAGAGEVTESRQPSVTASASAGREPSPPAVTSTQPARAPTARPPGAVPAATSPATAAQTASAAPATTPRAAPTRPATSPEAPTGGPARLTRVDVTVSSAQVIVALSLSGTAEYTTMMLNSPDRVVIDLANTSVATDRQYGSIDVADLGVERVRWAPFQADSPTARIVIDLMQPVSYAIESAASGLVVRLKPRAER
jgi:AMIN domain